MKKKYLIIIGAAFLLLVICTMSGMFVYWNIMLWNKVSSIDKKVNPPLEVEEEVVEEEVEEEVVEEEEAEEEIPIEKVGPMYSMDTFIVNLADEGEKRYLRVTLGLELKDEAVIKKIEQRTPQMRDSVLMILPTKKIKDIKSTEGKMALRDEIFTSLDALLQEGDIINIYFTEFVMQ